MDGFSFVILERTLDLVTDAMPSEGHRRAAECAEVIRGYIDAPVVDEKQLGLVVSELADLAHENGRFLIATRLRDFARQLRDNGRRLDAA
jgi:hypothetical protein